MIFFCFSLNFTDILLVYPEEHYVFINCLVKKEFYFWKRLFCSAIFIPNPMELYSPACVQLNLFMPTFKLTIKLDLFVIEQACLMTLQQARLVDL